MVPPTPLFQLPRRQVLLVRPLRVIKNKEQTVRPQLFEHVGVLEDEGRGGWVRGGGGVGVSGGVGALAFGVGGGGAVEVGFVEGVEVGGGGVVGGGGGRCADGAHGGLWLLGWGLGLLVVGVDVGVGGIGRIVLWLGLL